VQEPPTGAGVVLDQMARVLDGRPLVDLVDAY
jgi:hypothetical protein